jgi:hypothetical protein
MAVSGTLIARAAFAAHLAALGIACAVAIAMTALLTWRHGQAIYRERRSRGTSPRPPNERVRLFVRRDGADRSDRNTGIDRDLTTRQSAVSGSRSPLDNDARRLPITRQQKR